MYKFMYIASKMHINAHVSLMFEFSPGLFRQRSLHDLDRAHTSVEVLTKPRPRVCSHPAMKKNSHLAMKKNSPQYNNTK